MVMPGGEWIGHSIEPSPGQAAGNVLPVTALLRSTGREKIDFQFAR